MSTVFYSLEKGEKWLTPFEKRQWREKVKALLQWFEQKGIELTPWLQLRLRELLVLMFFIQRIEERFENKNTEIDIPETQELLKKKGVKYDEAIHTFDLLIKYLERLRTVVEDLERIKPVEQKHSQSQSISELVQDLVRCAKELETHHQPHVEPHIEGEREEPYIEHITAHVENL